MPSLVNTLRRCHSTVRGLRKAHHPRSTSPSRPARSAAPARSDRRESRPSAAAPSRRWPEAPCGRARRTPPCRSWRASRGPCAAARARRPGDSRGATTPRRADEPGRARDAAGCGQPLDRLAMQALGTLTLAHECPAARLDSQAPVGVAGRGGRDHALERTGRDLGFLGADRRFDQLGRCPGGELELRCLVGRSLGRGERPVVAGQPVEKDRAHPLGPLDAEFLTACPGVTDRGLDQWQGVRLASKRGEQQLGIRCNVGPSRLRDRLELGDRDGGSAKVAAPRGEEGPVGQVDRQPGQRARVAALPEKARADGMPAVLIPEELGRDRRQPAPAEVLLAR